MTKVFKWILFPAFFLVLWQAAVAGTELKNLSGDWLVYNKYFESYIPLQENDQAKVTNAVLRLEDDRYQAYQLRFTTSPGLVLFVNGRLFYKEESSKSKDTLRVQVKELLAAADSRPVWITFFHPQAQLPFKTVAIETPTKVAILPQAQTSKMQINYRPADQVSEAYFLVFLFLVLSFILYRNLYPRDFSAFYYFQKGLHKGSDPVVSGIFSVPVLWMTQIIALSLALLIELAGIPLSSYESVWSRLGVSFVYILGGFGAKFLYTYILANTFKVKIPAIIQCREILKFFAKFTLVLTPLATLLYFFRHSDFHFPYQVLALVVVSSMLFLSLRMLLIFFAALGFRNFYIFSYLCAAEIVPLVIAAKLLWF